MNQATQRPAPGGHPWRAALAAGLAASALLLAGCGRGKTTADEVSIEAIERRDIALTVEATGTVEPINLVEVKSKASGQILRMPVEIGSVVKPGDLLVQIDAVDVQNQFEQARAALNAAQARAQVAAAERRRSDDLFKEQVVTATENESKILDDANAKSALVAAETNLEIARTRLADATVRAPVAGTVLEKPVAVGTVISSATSSVSGGTTILKMADLNRVRVRTLVSESDIGQVRQGQVATVIVDAYPQRTFEGVVEKIEPQALVQQSVTMFPVLISLSNEGSLLLPGMNGEVTMTVDRRSNVLAVPVDAIRTMRDFAVVAPALGIDLEAMRTRMANARGGAPGGAPEAGGANAATRGAARADATPAASRGDSARAGGRGGWGGRGGRAMGDSAMARGGGQGRGSDAAGGGGSRRVMGGGSGGGFFGGGPPAGPGNAPAGGVMRRSGPSVAVVKTAAGYEPRMVRLGISDFEYTEVLGGLEEGDQVVLLGAVEQQAQRDEMKNRMRQRTGSGITTTTTTTQGGRGGASGGGGGAGGGGQRGGGR